MDLSLEQRLLRFLNREEEDEARSIRDLRALSIGQRVLESECVTDAVLERAAGDGAFVFTVRENLSKFRLGDAVAVGDGLDFDASIPLVYRDYDPENKTLVLERDRFSRLAEDVRFDAGVGYTIDRRPLGIRGLLRDVVRAGFADKLVSAVLHGEHAPQRDDARYARAASALAATPLNSAQREAGAAAIGSESLTLIQGPPGTGKTRLLAEIVKLLCRAGCRIVLSAYTHRAVDNALAAIRAADPELPLIKIGNAGSNAAELRQLGIRLDRRGYGLPNAGVVVAGTCFAIAKMTADERFHIAVFDEAGQMPIAHAIAGMLLSKRWMMFGDHRQLPPVITAHHADREVTDSVFARLHGLYGSHMLDTSYRMNDGVCEVVSRAFYGAALQSAPEAAKRRLTFRPGGHFDEVLDPERPVVMARVDHYQPGMRSPEEANLVADLCGELVERHGVRPADIAIIAPFRAQVRLIRNAIRRRTSITSDALVVDTVERIQGQEREVVLVSLAVGDPDTLEHRAAFFFSTNRLNVALSRARTKAVLVASRGAFMALPRDMVSLRAAAVFKVLFDTLPQVDLSALYVVRKPGPALR